MENPGSQSRGAPLFLVAQAPPQIPRQVSIINEKNATQLQMMNQWVASTHASLSFQSTRPTWQCEVPRLALEHDFLMYSILAATRYHVLDLRPDEPDMEHKLTVYHTRAIQGFRKALSNINQNNFQALLATSLLIMLLATTRKNDKGSESGLLVSQWLGLGSGIQSLFQVVGWDTINKSPISVIFDFYQGSQVEFVPPTLPKYLQQMMNIEMTDPDWPHFEALEQAMGLLGRLYTHLEQEGTASMALQAEIWSWAIQVTPKFCQLVQELRPRALIILAHYLPFLQFTGSLWTKDIGKKDIPTIIKIVGPEWRPLLEVPRLLVEMKDRDVVVTVMLAQLH
ncbi:hypothetical protein BP6252_13928 [Coleophoma cylindrospora]|uniref:Uncharacterized protein n=1 Tax=Coleophoma cylindrospora TaxID=1849047 RepID=A0A3D8Q5R5_9HELO|nr:hypothetical protein BP6252_13928 [Coleophoma cylindrospora]